MAFPADREVKLVIAGGKGWYYAEIFQLVTELDLQEAVIFPGFIPEAELADWYRAAELFIYPSLLEGFGLPVLEAMACGTPVVCSAIPSLLEIVGDSALTFPATDEAALVTQLQRAIASPNLRQNLKRQALRQSAQFSWQKSAEQTLNVYQWLFM